MKRLTIEKMAQLEAGSTTCAKSMTFSAMAGGLFGPAGAFVGATIAATGPSCLGWW